MKRAAANLRSAFQNNILTLPLSSIVPQRNATAEALRSSIFKQILSSVREIGLIEPLVVFPQEGKGFLLLDGHLRFEALKILGTEEVNCILSTDDESYSYNKRVNHIPPVAQHFMLMEALKSGVAEERIAATLNVDVAAIRRRAQMLEGICPEVVEMLRDKKLSLELFPILRKMKAIGQIATVELMLLRNDYSVSFAKTRLAISPPALLTQASIARQNKANSDAADTLLGEDTDGIIQNLKAIEETYGTDVLTLTVTCAYLDRLFSEAKIKNYLDRHHPGPLETLMTIISDMGRSGIQAKMADGL
jgi:RepB plasmid partitioning protein/ParB-like nuclease domain